MSILPELWDTVKGKVKNGAKDALDRNNYLQNLIYKVQEHKRHLIEKGAPLAAHNLRDAYLGLSEENRGVMGIFEEHNKKCEMLSGKDFAPGCATLPENRSIQNIFYRSEHPLCLPGEGAGVVRWNE